MAKKRVKSQWVTETRFGEITTLEELLELPPFREASGPSGESHTAAARIPSWMERRLRRFSEMKGSPYYVMSDVVRDAIFLGLHVLNVRHKLDPDWAVEAKMAEIVSGSGLMQRIRKEVTEISKNLTDMWVQGDKDRASESLEKYVMSASELSDDWHKNKVLELLRADSSIREVAGGCSDMVKNILLADGAGRADNVGKKHMNGGRSR